MQLPLVVDVPKKGINRLQENVCLEKKHIILEHCVTFDPSVCSIFNSAFQQKQSIKVSEQWRAAPINGLILRLHGRNEVQGSRISGNQNLKPSNLYKLNQTAKDVGCSHLRSFASWSSFLQQESSAQAYQQLESSATPPPP